MTLYLSPSMSLRTIFASIAVLPCVVAKIGQDEHARPFLVRAKTLSCCLGDALTTTFTTISQLSMPQEGAGDRLGPPEPHRSRQWPFSGETRINRRRPFPWSGHSWCHQSASFATKRNVRFDATSHCFRAWKQQQ